MTAQRTENTPDTPAWDRNRLRQALSTARHHSIRGSRRLGLAAPDREDLQQDILLAMLVRDRHYDPSRGAWSTFASVIARHVIADRARAERQVPDVEFLPLDVDDFPAGCSATQQDHVDPILTLDLRRVANELPAAPRRLMCLLGATGDVAEAQRASSQSCCGFYRAIQDLRFWLHASGMHAPRGVPRQRARAAG